jgi:hypothetical protein
MAKVDSYRCDQCGKQKAEVNHWWMATTLIGSHGRQISICEWSDDPSGFRHLCGQSCVVAELNAWMNTERD